MKTLDIIIGGACALFLAFYAGALTQELTRHKRTKKDRA